MNQPRVSVGLPVYNGENYLTNALVRLTEQDYEDFEIIICDNASTDRTGEICREFAAKDRRIRYFRNETNIGLAANHNRTFELARGEFFKWAAHDDDFPRPMLSRFVRAFEESPRSVSVVYAVCEYLDDAGRVIGADSDHVANNDPSAARRLAHFVRHIHMYSCIYGLIRSEMLRRTRLHGRFPGSDYVLVGELAMLGVLVELQEPLLRIRRHPGRTFNAYTTDDALRELFAPGEGKKPTQIGLQTRMDLELIRSACLVPATLRDKLTCTAVAVVKPQWEALRSSMGRQKRRIYQRFSSAYPAFRAGDLVQVRSKREILETLDKSGQLDGLPFMPEMFAYCGQIMRVAKRAHKTCDTVYEYKSRRMLDAVHLDGVRCGGQFHDGCEASCLIFWKTAWLRSLAKASIDTRRPPERFAGLAHATDCTEADVLAGSRQADAADGAPAYVCQATRLPAVTQPLKWWAPGQYVEDYTSGNVGFVQMAKAFGYKAYRRFFVNLGIGTGPLMMAVYDFFKKALGGTPYPHRAGKIPPGQRTPTIRLDLQPGEWVRVKPYDNICETIDERHMNRGMTFDKEMVPYCGGTFQVLKRVHKIVNERTGEIQEMKNPCIILDSVICQARYSECRLFCPRGGYPFWREAWLERVDQGDGKKAGAGARTSAAHAGHEPVGAARV